ncbi:MAG TPA: S8 family serine peptidase [Gaiellaceae bacterium]|nr:S8 family serine peptidase [Gaiellaceae bacterium]
MRRRITALAVLAIAALVAVTSATARTDAGADRYIVVLKPGTNARAVANEHAAAHAAAISFVYSHALSGYAATIPNARLAAVQADERVAYVEPDGEMSAIAQTLPWGIDRIDADVSSTRAGDGSGAVANVNVYVIDTGVDATHPDLNVVGHVAFAGGPNRDCHGHGTHVAGTIAARDDANDVVGVAPGAPITGVKVLGCNGSGSNSGVIAGIDWVTANAVVPAVANMSLGGGASQAIDDAVRRSAASGVFYALAAGNEGINACTRSPARAGAGTTNGIMTVAATDSADREASFSNYGTCVDVWAPGVSVLSTRKGGGTTTMSGTSMASPHGAGGGALYLSTHTGSSPSAVEGALKSAAQATGTASKDGRGIVREHVGGF